MKNSAILAIVVFYLSSLTDGFVLQERTAKEPRVVSFSVERRSISDPVSRDKLRRRGTASATLDNLATLYFANATLGTPPQAVRLHIDTGSSDLWVNTPKSDLCTSSGGPCVFAGSYSANASSTYAYLASDFNISYVDGSGASGDYATDTFSLGNTSLSSLQFGIGYSSSSTEGILGLGYAINEVQVGRAGKAAYDNLPLKLVADGLIQSNAYSLWLNDLDASTGSVLFGGVDTAKYTGSLQKLPIQKEQGVFAEFLITMTGLTLADKVIAKNLAQAVLLDSGSSLTYLPDAITEAIYEQVNAQYAATDGVAYVPCSLGRNETTMDFTFSTPTIKVPMNELVIQVTSKSGRQLAFTDGTPACLFGIAPAGGGSAVLGDTFMRSSYLVYDLANNEISIAQTNFNATTANIVEIGTGVSAVPDSTLVANNVAATAGVSTASSMSGSSGIGSELKKNSAASISVPIMSILMVIGAGVLCIGL